MNAATLFAIAYIVFVVAVVIGCLVAYLIVQGRINRTLQRLEADYQVELTSVIVREAFRK